MSSSRAQIERHVAEPDRAGRGGREHRVDVVGGGEEDADEVVVVDAVALEHLLEQRDDPLVDLLGGVVVDGGGAAQGSDGSGHRRRCYVPGLAAVGAAAARSERAHLVRGERRATRPASSARSASGPMRVRTRRTHGVADRLAHPPDLAVAALVDRERAAALGADERRLGRRGEAVVELDALAQPAQRGPARRALDLGQVLLLDAEATGG